METAQDANPHIYFGWTDYKVANSNDLAYGLMVHGGYDDGD